MDGVEKAGSGHPGMPMGMADVVTVLFTQFLKFSSAHPDWPDRDRFILSAGHGSMLLYSLLHVTGYKDMTLEELKRFRQWGSRTAGHPEAGHAKGIETTTGPLGQGLANGVGMALAERLLAAQFGPQVVDHFTYVVVGDGCLMEGISQEALSFAGHMHLGKLIVLFDDNQISIDGPTSLSTSDNALQRFEASGWHTQAIDGHDFSQIAAALQGAKDDPRPSLIGCRTQIGYGAPVKGGTAAAHGSPLGPKEIEGARQALGWTEDPFIIPAPLKEAWAQIGGAGREMVAQWEASFEALSPPLKEEFNRRQEGRLPPQWREPLVQLKERFLKERPSQATRVSSQKVLEVLSPLLPELVGGSADLTPSNNTKVPTMGEIRSPEYEGHYIHYGVREHGMGAIMNGMARHGGIIPYGGTFLVFSDYMRPAIRLSSLMKQRVIYVFTHDSIGLGEDGPTHQPVEHLASLRAIPDLCVYRPADAMEVAECWESALLSEDRPSVIALTRQDAPLVREEGGETPIHHNLSQLGAYVLWEAEKGKRDMTFLATGSEVSLALTAAQKLSQQGVKAVVVSMPCWLLFDQQPLSYQEEVLGAPHLPRVAVEAASPLGWHKYLGFKGTFVGMETFGASAPAADLFREFNITSEALVQEGRKALGL
jgi:transketolase